MALLDLAPRDSTRPLTLASLLTSLSTGLFSGLRRSLRARKSPQDHAAALARRAEARAAVDRLLH